ncbi:flagellar protein FlaG, partial [Massilia arenosa]
SAPVPAPRAPAAAVETAAAVERPAQQQPSPQQVHEAVDKLNKSLKQSSSDLLFSVDSDTDKVIVKLVDQNTKEVIRQIPSPEALELAKSLDSAQGRLIKQVA